MSDLPRFEEVIEAHADRIWRLCCGYVRDPATRDDVYQEVLVHLWQSLGGFRGDASVATWVYRITVNTCLGHLRSEQRRQRAVTEAAREGTGSQHDNAPGPADADRTEARITRLYECVHQLPPLDRALVSLYLEEAATEQIAEVLGITPANVRVRLHRARKALRAIWERTEDGTE